MKGSLLPERNADGRLTALDIMLEARNVAIDAQGSIKNPVAVDQVIFTGKAAIEEARLDIDDLVVMSGDAGIRLQGRHHRRRRNRPASCCRGRMKEMSAALLKQLWPPIIAAQDAQLGEREHPRGPHHRGRVHRSTCRSTAMAAAQRQRKLPQGSINLSLQDGRASPAAISRTCRR